MLNNFYSSNYRRIQGSVLLSGIETLHSHEIKNGVTDYFSEDCMFFIEMLTRSKSHKELRFVVIFASISHSNDTSFCKLKSLMEFVSERSTVNRLTSHTCTCGITTLYHESRDKSMKYCIDIIPIETVLDKVFRCQGSFFSPELNIDLTMTCVEYDFGSCRRLLCGNLDIHLYFLYLRIYYKHWFII